MGGGLCRWDYPFWRNSDRARSKRLAATGGSDDLIYVSPKSGRAVSRDVGAATAKLLPLPQFLIGRGDAAGNAVSVGLRLTAFWSVMLTPQDKLLPDARSLLRVLYRLRNLYVPTYSLGASLSYSIASSTKALYDWAIVSAATFMVRDGFRSSKTKS